MGQHKTNPTAILAKQGRIPPKEKGRRFTNNELIAFATEKVLGKGFIASMGGKPRKVRSDVFTEEELMIITSNYETLKKGLMNSLTEEEMHEQIRQHNEAQKRYFDKYKELEEKDMRKK